MSSWAAYYNLSLDGIENKNIDFCVKLQNLEIKNPQNVRHKPTNVPTSYLKYVIL